MLPENMNKGPKPEVKVRVKFYKTGSLKFISHLDLNRTMQSAFLRSRLPIWYSEGFNPHPKVVFSPPLSVGVSSLTEFVDFKMLHTVEPKEIIERLNASFPKGLSALECYIPETRFCDIKWGMYEIKYSLSGIPDDICERVKNALSREEIIVEKKSKSGGIKSVNIAEGIKFISSSVCDGDFVLRIMLSCDELSFVNPKYITDTLEKELPEIFSEAENTVCRTEVYLADGKTLFS